MKNLKLLVVLIALLGGGGYYNYQRNLAKEEKEKTAYAAYSTEQLQALVAAYEAEIGAAGKRYAAEKSNRHEAADKQYADDQMREFDKAAARGQAIRDAGGDLSVREAALRDIKKELGNRSGSQSVFLRRLLTI